MAIRGACGVPGHPCEALRSSTGLSTPSANQRLLLRCALAKTHLHSSSSSACTPPCHSLVLVCCNDVCCSPPGGVAIAEGHFFPVIMQADILKPTNGASTQLIRSNAAAQDWRQRERGGRRYPMGSGGGTTAAAVVTVSPADRTSMCNHTGGDEVARAWAVFYSFSHASCLV